MLQLGCCRAVMGKHFTSSETPSLCQAPTDIKVEFHWLVYSWNKWTEDTIITNINIVSDCWTSLVKSSVSHDVICYRNRLELSEPMMLEMEMWNHLKVNEGWLLQCCIKSVCAEWDCLNKFHSRRTELFRNGSHDYYELKFTFLVLIQVFFFVIILIWIFNMSYRLTELLLKVFIVTKLQDLSSCFEVFPKLYCLF